MHPRVWFAGLKCPVLQRKEWTDSLPPALTQPGVLLNTNDISVNYKNPLYMCI